MKPVYLHLTAQQHVPIRAELFDFQVTPPPIGQQKYYFLNKNLVHFWYTYIITTADLFSVGLSLTVLSCLVAVTVKIISGDYVARVPSPPVTPPELPSHCQETCTIDVCKLPIFNEGDQSLMQNKTDGTSSTYFSIVSFKFTHRFRAFSKSVSWTTKGCSTGNMKTTKHCPTKRSSQVNRLGVGPFLNIETPPTTMFVVKTLTENSFSCFSQMILPSPAAYRTAWTAAFP